MLIGTLLLTIRAWGLDEIAGDLTQLPLTPENSQFEWEDWGITIDALQFDEYGSTTDTPIIDLVMTVVNHAHKSRSFPTPLSIKLVIGEDQFDAIKEIGEGGVVIQPTMQSIQGCYFIVPRARLGKSFDLRFEDVTTKWLLHVEITQPPPPPEPTPAPPPTEEEIAAAKKYWANERARKAQEEAEAKQRFAKEEAIRESRGDFSQAPGMTPEQKRAAAIKWAEEDAKKNIIGATPAPQ